MYQSTQLMNTFTHLDKLLNIVLVSTFPINCLVPQFIVARFKRNYCFFQEKTFLIVILVVIISRTKGISSNFFFSFMTEIL